MITFILFLPCLWWCIPILINSYKIPPPIKYKSIGSPIHKNNSLDLTPLQKMSEYIKLTRLDKNAIPVTILTGLSGIVANPMEWRTWIVSSPFLSAFSMVQIITSASMVINDLYDIETDKINNPNRPLVKGTILPREAKALIIALFSIYSFLGITELPIELSPIWISSMVTIILYTPVLKKILFIKNLACSTVISMAVPFLGLSTISNINTYQISPWMKLTAQLVFVTSIFIEIMMDISDKKGDKEVGIMTLPGLLDTDKTLNSLFYFLLMNYFYSLKNIVNMDMILAIISVYLPHFCSIIELKRNNKILLENIKLQEYSQQKIIKKSIKNTTISMLIYSIIYMIYIHVNPLH